jgi:hypothetical protein
VRNEDDVERERADKEEQAAQIMAANMAIQSGANENGIDPRGAPQLPSPNAPIVEMARGG